MGENFVDPLEIVGICVVAVFAVSAFLTLFLYCFGYLFRNKKSKMQSIAPHRHADAHIAAIAACINCFYETEKRGEEFKTELFEEPEAEFVVKSIKRRKFKFNK